MRLFTSALIRSQLSQEELDSLKKDFKEYKNSNIVPARFGRDAPYNHSNSPRILLTECVMHIHLDDTGEWNDAVIQHYRTSDVHLVYCQGSIDEEKYLLIMILSPDAHAQIKQTSTWTKIGEIAEQFRLVH